MIRFVGDTARLGVSRLGGRSSVRSRYPGEADEHVVSEIDAQLRDAGRLDCGCASVFAVPSVFVQLNVPLYLDRPRPLARHTSPALARSSHL